MRLAWSRSSFSLSFPQAISLFLIGVVIASRTLSYFTSPTILAGLAVCASVLFLVAILGLAGTIKHHQVVLFFVSLCWFGDVCSKEVFV